MAGKAEPEMPEKNKPGPKATGRARKNQLLIRLSADELAELEKFQRLGSDEPPALSTLARDLLLRHAHSVLSSARFLTEQKVQAEAMANLTQEERDAKGGRTAQECRVVAALWEAKLRDVLQPHVPSWWQV